MNMDTNTCNAESKFKAELFKCLYHGIECDIHTLIETHQYSIPLKDVQFKCLSSRSCGCFWFYKIVEGDILTESELDRYAEMIENGRCPCPQSDSLHVFPVVIRFYPIHIIVWRNHAHLIPYLITNDCDINVEDTMKDTALIQGIQSPGRLDTVMELLKVNAHKTGPSGVPLLRLALKYHHEDCIEPLIEHGCNVNEVYNGGSTLLLEAVTQSSSQFMVHKLLRLGADVNVNCVTAYKCMEKAIRWRDDDFLQLLVSSGCDVNSQPEPEHLTALQMTVCQGLTNMTEILIKAGADVNKCVNDIPPPLSLAAGEGRMQEARLLIEAGCDVNQTQDHQYSAMHFAAWEGHYEMVQLLLDHDAMYKKQTRDKNTPLALACHGNWPQVIAKLLTLDKNVNNADKDLDCPLHYTTFNSNFECSLWLISEGADPHAENRLRVTPVWNATYVNNAELVALLVKANVDVSIPSVGIDQAANSDLPVTVYPVPRTALQVAIMKNYVQVAQLLALQMKLQDIVEQMNYLIVNNDLMEDVVNGTDGIMSWYKQTTSCPRSLLFICGWFVRQHLGRNIFHSVEVLEIPVVLKRYLTLAHIKLKEQHPYDIVT